MDIIDCHSQENAKVIDESISKDFFHGFTLWGIMIRASPNPKQGNHSHIFLI